MKKGWLALLTLIIIGMLAGCGTEQKKSGDNPTNLDGKANRNRNFAASKRESGLPVEVTRLEKGTIGRKLMYSGTIETENMTQVMARVSGQIREIRVDEGRKVSADSVVLVIDDREYKIQEQKARVNYLQLKSSLNRLIELKKDELVSEEEFEQTQFSMEQAKLDWQLARMNLEYTRVRAPFGGVVTERFVKLGDYIQPNTPLFNIANMSQKIVKVYIPQNETPLISLNLSVEVKTDILPDLVLSGWVKRISPSVDVESGTFKVTAGVRDPQNKVLPGQFVNVAIIVAKHENALLLPKAALVYENDRAFFFTVDGDSVRKVEARIGFDDADKVELLQLLPEGTPVVVVGQSGLKDGSKVRIVSEKIFNWQKKQQSFAKTSAEKTRRFQAKGNRPPAGSKRKKHIKPGMKQKSSIKSGSGE